MALLGSTPPWMSPGSSFRNPDPTQRPTTSPRPNFQQAINGVQIGQPDASGNVWNYQRVSYKPGGANSPFKPKTVTYLVNQHGVHFQDWFQRSFGIDKAGKPVNPLAQPNPTLVPPNMPRNTPPPMGHAAAKPVAGGNHHPVSTGGGSGPPPVLGLDTRVSPKLLANIAAAMKGGGVPMPSANVPTLPTIDPTQYANQFASAYDPAVNDIKQQQAGASSILPGQINNIDQWYRAVQQQAAQGGAANQAAYQQAQTGATNDAQKLMSSLGGGTDTGAAYALGQRAANNNTDLAGQQAQQASIDNALQTNIAGESAGAKQAATTNVQALLSSLGTQLSQALSQQGQAKNSAYEQGVQLADQTASQNLTNKSTVQNMRLAAALAGPQVVGAKLANLAAAQGMQDSAQQAGISAQQANQNAGQSAVAAADAHQNAVVQRYLATHPGAGSKSFTQNLSDPGYVGALHKALWTGGMVNPTTGQMTPNPQRAYELIMGQLSASHPNTPVSVLSKFARNEVAKQIPTSGYANKGWKFVNGKFTK